MEQLRRQNTQKKHKQNFKSRERSFRPGKGKKERNYKCFKA